MSAAVGDALRVHGIGPQIGSAMDMPDISQLIRLKERELHEIHDLRCGQLENLVKERDMVITGLKSRFEQLKDDFSYNLTLLGARDEEIQRLEHDLQKREAAMVDSETQLRNLKARVDVLELREVQRNEQREQERASSKNILTELREVTESMRWAAAEEAKAKDREISLLKADNRMLAVARDEALESQRRDLTETFEGLLKQREMAYSKRETDIGAQVSALESKFDQLNTLNSRLKCDLQDSRRRAEAALQESASREERCQQLQWMVDDERTRATEMADVHARQMNIAQTALSSAQASAAQQQRELQSQIDRLLAEVTRGQEFRTQLETRLEDVCAHGNAQSKDRAAEIASILRDRAIAQSEAEASRAATAIARAEAARFQDEMHACLTKLAACEAEAAVQVSTIKEQASRNADNQNIQLRSLEDSLSAEKVKISKVQAALEAVKTELQAKTKALLEEQHESAALRLRMQVQDQATGSSRRGHDSVSDSNDLSNNAFSARPGHASVDGVSGSTKFVKGAYTGSQDSPSTDNGNISTSAEKGPGLGIEPPSPLFSEDFGDVSLPASPDTSIRPGRAFYERNIVRNGVNEEAREGTKAFLKGIKDHAEVATNNSSVTGKVAAGAPAQPIAATIAAAVESATNSLQVENERLRVVIQRMRNEMEALQVNAMSLAPAVTEADEAAMPALQARLKRMTDEVARLRAERRTMMDTANDLRNALKRAGGALPLPQVPPLPQAPPLPMQPALSQLQNQNRGTEELESSQHNKQQPLQHTIEDQEDERDYPPRGRRSAQSQGWDISAPRGPAGQIQIQSQAHDELFDMGLTSAHNAANLGVVGSSMGGARRSNGGRGYVNSSAGTSLNAGRGRGGVMTAPTPAAPGVAVVAGRKVVNYSIGLKKATEEQALAQAAAEASAAAPVLERPSRH